MSHAECSTPHGTEDSLMRSERTEVELKLYGLLALYAAQQSSRDRGVVLREFAREMKPLLDAKYTEAPLSLRGAGALVNPFDLLDAEQCQRCGQQVKP